MAFAPSPFPGMDPWLEGWWGDVDRAVISGLSDQIAEGLPDDLFVVVEERVVVLDPDGGGGGQLVPDAAVLDRRSRRVDATPTAGAGAVAIAEPVRIPILLEPEIEGVIEVREVRSDRPLVTAVEVSSPTNQFNSRGRRDWRRTRRAYVRAGVNVVELDLLRGGPEVVGVPGGRDRLGPAAACRCVIRRGGRLASEVEHSPIRLRERLPRLRVPLRPTDPDAVIDLQRPIDHVYRRRGRYDLHVDDGRPPDPPLSADDAAWAAERVAHRTGGDDR